MVCFLIISVITALILTFGTSAKSKTDKIKTYPVFIDSKKTVEQMVADGHYDWSNSNINSSNFFVPNGGQTKSILRLIRFGREITTGEALVELEQQGFRPASLSELLAFGAKFPDLQKKFKVVALGAVWIDSNNYSQAAFLGSFGDKRGLGLSQYRGGYWHAGFRFLAVKKN